MPYFSTELEYLEFAKLQNVHIFTGLDITLFSLSCCIDIWPLCTFWHIHIALPPAFRGSKKCDRKEFEEGFLFSFFAATFFGILFLGTRAVFTKGPILKRRQCVIGRVTFLHEAYFVVQGLLSKFVPRCECTHSRLNFNYSDKFSIAKRLVSVPAAAVRQR